MKKSGSKIIPFPFSRRSEQNGLTQKGTPARWLGVLLVASAGAAWALSPTIEPTKTRPIISPSGVVVEGEPQVVSQLMGSILGAESAPKAELKGLAGWNEGRVVLEQVASDKQPTVPVARLLSLAEELEAYASANGRYPTGLSMSGEDVAGLTYSNSRAGFRLESEQFVYDSRTGIERVEQAPEKSFRVGGSLTTEKVGWGPFTQEVSRLQASPGRTESQELAWLETLGPAPEWSARMFFPVEPAVTGPVFLNNDLESVYKNGELTFDAVKGTFSLKLHRKEKAACLALDAASLELELESRGLGLAGDSVFLRDLGFGEPAEDEGVVCLATDQVLPLSHVTELEQRTHKELCQNREALVAGKHKSVGGSSSVALVGRVKVVDKMGQLHELRLRGGRGLAYDWVVGQLCPLEEPSVSEAGQPSQADSFERPRRSKVKIVAGK